MHNILRKYYYKRSELPASTLAAVFIVLSLLLSACGSSGLLGNGSWQASGLQKQQLRVLEVNAKNLRNLYTGDVQGHIFVSTNAGQNWTEQSAGLPLPDPIHALSFDTTGQKLYAATDKGLFTSTNSATRWTALPTTGLPSTSFTALAFDPDNAKVVYAATTDQGIYMTTDGGNSWLIANKGLPSHASITDLSFDPIQHQLWAATPSGAYRADEHAASWQPFNASLPSTIHVNTVIPASTIGGATGLLYMGTNHGFFLSQDSGTHWTASPEALSGTNIRHILLDYRNTNAITIYIATDVGVFHSSDNGQSWLAVAGNLPKNTPTYALAFAADNSAQLYAIGSGIYQFPGTTSAIDPTHILPLLLVAAFFFLLYRLSQRGRGTRRTVLKPDHIPAEPIPKPDNPPPPA